MALISVGPSRLGIIRAPTTLILLRHGRALGVHGRCIGHTDVALSRKGAREIRQFASDWRNRVTETVVGAPTAIYSSDLLRARNSAQVVGTIWRVPVEQDVRLREVYFGAWDGLRWDAIGASDGASLRAWAERWTDGAPPGGEGIGQIERRAVDWIEGIISAGEDSERTIVVVSHAGWIRVALSRLLCHPIARMFDMPVDYARATIVSVRPRATLVFGANLERIPSMAGLK